MKKDYKSIPIEPDVHKKMQQAKVDTGKDIYTLIREAWELYSSEGHAAPPGGNRRAQTSAKPVLVERRHGDQQALLDFILEHGTKEDAAWITGNLKNFAEAIESRHGQHSGPKRKRASS